MHGDGPIVPSLVCWLDICFAWHTTISRRKTSHHVSQFASSWGQLPEQLALTMREKEKKRSHGGGTAEPRWLIISILEQGR